MEVSRTFGWENPALGSSASGLGRGGTIAVTSSRGAVSAQPPAKKRRTLDIRTTFQFDLPTQLSDLSWNGEVVVSMYALQSGMSHLNLCE